MECAAILRRGWHYGRGFKRRNLRRRHLKRGGTDREQNKFSRHERARDSLQPAFSFFAAADSSARGTPVAWLS
jgi:hypothetical protein